MSRFTVPAVVSLAVVAASGALAQGDAAALKSLNTNRPNKAWAPWSPKPTYAINELPDQYMSYGAQYGYAQVGYNTCANNTWNQQSMCQTAWVNSLTDFCVFAPSVLGPVGEQERNGVAYCTTNAHGTRLIPDGTITGAHFVKSTDYVQVTGVGDFTSMNIPAGDSGGEFDNHGADDLENPVGAVVYTTANPASNGQPYFIPQWTNFMSASQFCIRACWGDNAALQCQHMYDVLGCDWNLPANYAPDVFESCESDVAQLQGIYGGSTFQQGDAYTPPAHPAPNSSQCQTVSTIRNGLFGKGASGVTSSTASASTSTSVASSSSSAATSSASGTMSKAASSSAGASTGRAAAASATASGLNSLGNAAAGSHAAGLTTFVGVAAAGIVGALAVLAI